MTTQTEALKLALKNAEAIVSSNLPQDCPDCEATMVWVHSMAQSIVQSIKEALAQPEQEPVAQHRDLHSHMMVVAHRAVAAVTQNGRKYCPDKVTIRAICEAIQADKNLLAKLAPQPAVAEQHKQEPKHVATVAEVHMSRYTIEWTNGPLPEGAKLYTTAQQRTWVGLTDEDLANCDDTELKQALYWEQILKEKNT